MCTERLRGARSRSGTEWPLAASIHLGTLKVSLVAPGAELVPGLRPGRPDESLVFVGTGFRDLAIGQLEGEKRMGGT